MLAHEIDLFAGGTSRIAFKNAQLGRLCWRMHKRYVDWLASRPVTADARAWCCVSSCGVCARGHTQTFLRKMDRHHAHACMSCVTPPSCQPGPQTLLWHWPPSLNAAFHSLFHHRTWLPWEGCPSPPVSSTHLILLHNPRRRGAPCSPPF